MWNPKFRYSMNGWLDVSSEWYLYRWIGEKTKKMIAGVMDKWMDKYWEPNSGRKHGRVDCRMHWETGACVDTESCMYRCIIIDTCINVRTSGEMQLLQMMMMMDECVKRILCRNIFFWWHMSLRNVFVRPMIVLHSRRRSWLCIVTFQLKDSFPDLVKFNNYILPSE